MTEEQQEQIKEAVQIAEELGRQKEQTRIAKAFYEYRLREDLPIQVQKDLMNIIGIK